jgi:DNA protecting protein DprA
MITRIPFQLAHFTFLEIESQEDPAPLLQQLPESGLGVVGTRYPQRKSFDLLEKTMAELKDSGLVIISGFARGIDSRAHELALDHGLKTIAILGCGLNIDYPAGNQLLRKRILDAGGLILSPYERDTPAYAGNFLERNRAIAHFSKAVWIVEAAKISGSLNTARHASDLNKDIYATACFPNDRYFEGNQDLLSQQKTHIRPVADLFFNAWSMNKTWSHLQPPLEKKKPFNRLQVSRLQKWVLEIQEDSGFCTQQRLVEIGLNSGLSSGEFFSEYKAELQSGKLKLDPNGVIDLP